MDVAFVAAPIGRGEFRGEVIDQKTHECLGRTGRYGSAETARSAAASMWRVMQAQAAQQAAA